MKKIGIAAVVMLVAAACSSSSTDATTTTVGGGDGGATSTSAAPGTTGAPGTTAATTTTTEAPPDEPSADGLAGCVLGTWELDSEHFFDQIADGLNQEDEDVEFEFLGGAYQIAAMPDGTFTASRIDWSFGGMTEFGDIEITMNHNQVGTYTIDGDTMSTVIPAGGDPADLEIKVDGVPFDFPGGINPIEPPDASFESAVPDCDDEALIVTADGYSSIWNRIG